VLQYANFLQTIESFDEAEKLYRRTLAADPTHADALNNLVCEPRLSVQCERKDRGPCELEKGAGDLRSLVGGVRWGYAGSWAWRYELT
jgi:hypothetical protein